MNHICFTIKHVVARIGLRKTIVKVYFRGINYFIFMLACLCTMEGQSGCLDKNSLTCSICTKKAASYTCPRCSINYCSLGCYRDRRHEKCSEIFYRECCEQAITNMRPDSEPYQQVKRMMEQEDQITSDVDESVGGGDGDEESSSEEETELSER